MTVRLCSAVIWFLPLVQALSSGPPPQEPQVIGLNGAALAKLRARPPAESLAWLLDRAGRRLAEPLVAVTDKQVPSPSGNPHDYVSLARYWWPNPKTANGLPYVQRDGEVNPENGAYDRPRFEQMVQALEDLSLAWFLTREPAYAERAARQLRTWFLDEATRMTPHLEHAQLIKGINDGRGIGIIDVRGLISIVDSEALLRGSPAWPDSDHEDLKAWFGRFYQWLTTSRHGREEESAANNHGTWYDVLSATIALFLGNEAAAVQICNQAKTRRITRQIEPDGRQPLELQRTLAFFYALFNLEGLCRLAVLGERVNVDLWHFQTQDGRGIRAALEWLIPFATGEQPWKFQQTGQPDSRPLVGWLREAARAYREPSFEAVIARLPDAKDELPRANLLHPRI